MQLWLCVNEHEHQLKQGSATIINVSLKFGSAHCFHCILKHKTQRTTKKKQKHWMTKVQKPIKPRNGQHFQLALKVNDQKLWWFCEILHHCPNIKQTNNCEKSQNIKTRELSCAIEQTANWALRQSHCNSSDFWRRRVSNDNQIILLKRPYDKVVLWQLISPWLHHYSDSQPNTVRAIVISSARPNIVKSNRILARSVGVLISVAWKWRIFCSVLSVRCSRWSV